MQARFAWRRTLRWAAVAAGIAALGLGGWYVLVREGILRYNKYDHRERGRLRAGDPAPDLTLAAYEGGTVRLSELWRERPVVLVFGSCT